MPHMVSICPEAEQIIKLATAKNSGLKISIVSGQPICSCTKQTTCAALVRPIIEGSEGYISWAIRRVSGMMPSKKAVMWAVCELAPVAGAAVASYMAITLLENQQKLIAGQRRLRRDLDSCRDGIRDLSYKR